MALNASQNNPGGVADDQQDDALDPTTGKPKSQATVPGTQPNVDPAPLPGVAALTPTTSGAVPVNSTITETAQNLTPPVGTPAKPDYGVYTDLVQDQGNGMSYVPGWGSVKTADLPQFFMDRYGSATPQAGAAAQASGTINIDGTQANFYGNPGDIQSGSTYGDSFAANPDWTRTVVPPTGGDLSPPPSGSSAIPGGQTITSTTQNAGLPAAAPLPTSSGGGTGGAGNVVGTPTTPDNALTNQTLSRAPSTDRLSLANQYLDAWNQATDPQFQSDLRTASRQAAGKGQIGSGMLRTNYGNITQARDTQRNAAEQNFLTNAQNQSIEDAFRDVGIAQQQQGFQSGQQQNAFQQALQQALTEDQLTGNSFQRALQQAQFGYQGNPGDTQLALSGFYGNQANQAGNAAGGLGQASAGQANTSPYMNAIMQYLQSLGIGGSPGGTPLPSGLPNG